MATPIQTRQSSVPIYPTTINTPSSQGFSANFPSGLTFGANKQQISLARGQLSSNQQGLGTLGINSSNQQITSSLQNLSPFDVSEKDSQSTSKLTIYSRSGHIVQKYPQGTKLVMLPKSVEIASIVAIDTDGVVVPFSYVPETTMGISLTDRSTGEKVQAMVVKDGETTNGKILSIDNDNVMLMTENYITNIHKYDKVIVGINEDLTRPRLELVRDSKPFTLSYLLSSISWKCVGTALVDNIKNIIYLRLAGNITNNTESDIRANTTLVSGEVYQYRGRQNKYADSQSYAASQSLMVAPGPMRSQNVQSSMLEDYVKYEVGDRLIRTQDVAELGTWQIPVIKLYIHKTDDNDIVQFGYRFVSPGYIPTCSLNVYSIDANKEIDSYLGSNEVDESQKTDEIDIILGESTMLQCKSLVVVSSDIIVEDETTLHKFKLSTTRSNNKQSQQTTKGATYSDDRRWHIITEDLKVEITNHNDRPVSLVLKHFVGNKNLIETRCQAYKDRKNGFIEWYFEIPPKTSSEPRKESFACQIVTAQYY